LPEDCIDRANTLINALAEPIEVRGFAMQVGISIGIAVFPEDGATDFELMKHADAAMYAAKAEGVSAYRFFSRR
jgi:diguanylate cyclase (GGDEF)-like protein